MGVASTFYGIFIFSQICAAATARPYFGAFRQGVGNALDLQTGGRGEPPSDANLPADPGQQKNPKNP
jgi:hypothetical protein